MTSFSSWGEVNIAQSESTASNLQTTWDTVWPDPRIRDVFNFNSYQLYPACYVLCCSILGKPELVKGLSVTTILLTLL